MSKKVLSLILALIMVTCALPVMADEADCAVFSAYDLSLANYTYANNFVPDFIDEDIPYLHHVAAPGDYTNNDILVRFASPDVVLNDYEYVAFMYRSDTASGIIDISTMSKAGESWMNKNPKSEPDGKWHKVIVALDEINGTAKLPADGETNVQLRIKPFGGGKKTLTKEHYFDLMYIGFFNSKEAAEAYEFSYDASVKAEYEETQKEREELIKNHYLVGTDEIIKKYTDETYALIEKIENSPTEVSVSGTKYYVSSSGNDTADGKSPETAWATLTKVNSFKFNEGDGVFFKRGDKFNGALTIKNGVTYSAYGTGKKPVINGTTDASGETDWIATEAPNVYKYAKSIASPSEDVGKIIFDNGDAWGVKVLKLPGEDKRADVGEAFNGLERYSAGAGKFAGGHDLAYDLEFYHDPDESALYLYSRGGNPASRFDSIELVTKLHGVSGGNTNILIDNLEVRGFGAHGVSVTNAKNFRVQYCVLDWIGGSVQQYNADTRPTRYGNAIQNWTNCDGFYIDHCYSYQIFDCCYTTQWQGDSNGKDVIMTNIEFSNNVAMYANTGLEVWSGAKVHYDGIEVSITNMRMHHNYNLYLGHGMTTDRTADKKDANLIYGSCDEGGNNSVDNNVLLFSSSMIYYSSTIGPKTYNFHDNTYIVNEGTLLGRISANTGSDSGGTKTAKLNPDTVGNMLASGADPGTEFYVVPADNFYTVPEYKAPDTLSGYTDINNHWGREYISHVTQKGYFNGVSADKFAPDATMTRAMATTVLMRMANGTAGDTLLPYTDVNASAWYVNSLKWAYKNGIIDGGTSFRPDANITREELADMLYRTSMLFAKDGDAKGELTFKDAASVKYKDALLFCTGAGIIGGYSDNTVKPQNSATRAEVSTMIKRFEKYLGRTEADKEKLIERSGFKTLAGQSLFNALDTSLLKKALTDTGSVRLTTFGEFEDVRPMVNILNDLVTDFNIMEYPYVIITCKTDHESPFDINIKYGSKECWPDVAYTLGTQEKSYLHNLTAFTSGSGLPTKDEKNIVIRISPFGKKYTVNPETDFFEISSIKFFDNYDTALASMK